MLNTLKKLFKRASVEDLPKEPSLSDKIYQRVIDDLKKYPSHEWKRVRGKLSYGHPSVVYELVQHNWSYMEPENVPYGVLDDIHQKLIGQLWDAQIRDKEMEGEKEKFDQFLNKTGLQ